MAKSHRCNVERSQKLEYILYDFILHDFKNRLICGDRNQNCGYLLGEVLIGKGHDGTTWDDGKVLSGW